MTPPCPPCNRMESCYNPAERGCTRSLPWMPQSKQPALRLSTQW